MLSNAWINWFRITLNNHLLRCSINLQIRSMFPHFRIIVLTPLGHTCGHMSRTKPMFELLLRTTTLFGFSSHIRWTIVIFFQFTCIQFLVHNRLPSNLHVHDQLVELLVGFAHQLFACSYISLLLFVTGDRNRICTFFID